MPGQLGDLDLPAVLVDWHRKDQFWCVNSKQSGEIVAKEQDSTVSFRRPAHDWSFLVNVAVQASLVLGLYRALKLLFSRAPVSRSASRLRTMADAMDGRQSFSARYKVLKFALPDSSSFWRASK